MHSIIFSIYTSNEVLICLRSKKNVNALKESMTKARQKWIYHENNENDWWVSHSNNIELTMDDKKFIRTWEKIIFEL